MNAEVNDSIIEQSNPNQRALVGYVVNNWMQSKNSRTGVWGSAKLNITYKNLRVPNGYQENGTSAARRPNTDVGEVHGYLVTQLYRVW